MGVYHFMGVGHSVGAVTTALSYIAARYERDNPADQAFFAGSGEVEQAAEKKRGDVQALVLFTTEEIYRSTLLSNQYKRNQPGQSRGQEGSPEGVPSLIKRLSKRDLTTLTETNRVPGQSKGRSSIEVYWCLYEPNRPTQTFERVAQCLAAVKSPGSLGKEVWINLTGGSNVLNSAMQLAISLSGESARLYYTWTEHIDCIHHTVPRSILGSKDDQFWVDLPVVYFNFNQAHQKILKMLEVCESELCSVKDVYSRCVDGLTVKEPLVDGEPIEAEKPRLEAFRNQYLMPLIGQQFLVFASDKRVGVYEKAIRIGPNWANLQRYYRAFPSGTEQLTLPKIAAAESWLFAQQWAVKA